MRASTMQALLALALLAACDCGRSHGLDAGDAGHDAGRDAGRDGGRDAGRDAGGRDAADADGGRLLFPDGWERVGSLPAFCNAWRPLDVRRAVRPLRFYPCMPEAAGCEELGIEWDRAALGGNLIRARAGHQTWGDAPVIFLGIPWRGYWDESVYALDGTPVAVWRVADAMASEPWCLATAAAVAGDEMALAFDVSPGSGVPGFGVAFLVGPLESLQRAEVRSFVPEERLLSRGNGPNELLFDGENLVMHGLLGSVYLGWMGGRDFGEIATGRTGDVFNVTGMLWEGAMYWSSSPAGEPGWGRIRRRRGSETVNETFLQLEVGTVAGFRTDGTWATWLHYAHEDADGEPDRTDVYAARTGGRMDPSTWAPEIVATLRYPNAAEGGRPILTGGMLGLLVSIYEVRLIDLERRRTISVRVPRTRFFWETLLHLGPEYLFVTYQTVSPMDGMRRYRIADLEGWEPY